MKELYHSLFPILLIAVLWHSCTQPFTQGKALYDTNCSRCHGMDGKGFEDLYPSILQSLYLTEDNTNLTCVIAYGSIYLDTKRDTTAEVNMPGNQQLSAVEVLNIVNYLSWEYGDGNQRKIEQVMQTLEDCLP